MDGLFKMFFNPGTINFGAHNQLIVKRMMTGASIGG